MTPCPAGYRLAELLACGPHVEHHAPNTIQPFSEAAFDPNDREMLRRIDTPAEPADSPGYPDDDHDLDDVTLYDDTDADDDVYRAPVTPARGRLTSCLRTGLPHPRPQTPPGEVTDDDVIRRSDTDDGCQGR